MFVGKNMKFHFTTRVMLRMLKSSSPALLSDRLHAVKYLSTGWDLSFRRPNVCRRAFYWLLLHGRRLLYISWFTSVLYVYKLNIIRTDNRLNAKRIVGLWIIEMPSYCQRTFEPRKSITLGWKWGQLLMFNSARLVRYEKPQSFLKLFSIVKFSNNEFCGFSEAS